MSGFSASFKQAFGRDKPHSSITDWVEILTGPSIAEEAYDGIPELVESINLQASGPAEASRALRKKLKHGNTHQQYRSLVLLTALVENCGTKFQTTVADGQLTDVLRLIASDALGNARVKKKLILVLGAWREQYKDDPSMAYFANLYRQCRLAERKSQVDSEIHNLLGAPNVAEDLRRAEKAKAKEEKRRAKEKARADEEARRSAWHQPPRTRRVPFDFDRDKPKVLESIVEASQASSNLINAITLVDLDKESLQENIRVQDCVEKAREARKTVMRFTQLVENEDLIGTLIESTERVVAALETYDQMVAAGKAAKVDATEKVAAKLAATTISRREVSSDSEDAFSSSSPPRRSVHPDLEDLQFGALGSASQRLPPPIQPSKPRRYSNEDEDDEVDRRGSLSDFSDYVSSDEEAHNARAKAKAGPSARKKYAPVSDDDDDIVARFASPSHSKAQDDDPFADPFADDVPATRRR